MPITTPLSIRNLTQPEFDDRDAIVMRCAYAAQNALGRLCDERVYENDLSFRLSVEGFKSVYTQVPVTVTHDGYERTYRLDLVADDALYELKAAVAFDPQHDAQLLHYAMLIAINHAKLINFRTTRVQGRLRFNVLLPPARHKLLWDDSNWQPLSPQCEPLKTRACGILEDWGACLDCRLYEEALVHFCGGEAECYRRVPIVRAGVELGSHLAQCHGDDVFFVVTAFSGQIDVHQSHIERLLMLTRLRGVQWINLNRLTAQFITIERPE